VGTPSAICLLPVLAEKLWAFAAIERVEPEKIKSNLEREFE
jgi:hypothetical protein